MAIEPECICSYMHTQADQTGLGGHVLRSTNPLCPIHGDVRDTGFVIDNKDDYITAIEDAIEELESLTHTPGPWEWGTDGTLNGVPYFHIFLDDGDGLAEDRDIAWTRNAKSSCLNGEANARLIAAAPELLEALEAILAFMGRDKEPVADHKVWMNAHIAIAKARGQS